MRGRGRACDQGRRQPRPQRRTPTGSAFSATSATGTPKRSPDTEHRPPPDQRHDIFVYVYESIACESAGSGPVVLRCVRRVFRARLEGRKEWNDNGAVGRTDVKPIRFHDVKRVSFLGADVSARGGWDNRPWAKAGTASIGTLGHRQRQQSIVSKEDRTRQDRARAHLDGGAPRCLDRLDPVNGCRHPACQGTGPIEFHHHLGFIEPRGAKSLDRPAGKGAATDCGDPEDEKPADTCRQPTLRQAVGHRLPRMPGESPAHVFKDTPGWG